MANDIRSLLQAAFAAQSTGALTEAESICNQVLGREPRSLDARMLLGVIAARTERQGEAVSHFKQVLGSDPTAYMAMNWLCKVFRELGHTDAAIEMGEKAVVARPNDPDILFNLGLAYADADRSEDALRSIERAIAIRPGHAGYHFSSGTLYTRMGRHLDAVAAFQKAAAIAPEPGALLRLAEAQSANGETDAAISSCLEALRLEPSRVEARILMARALLDAGRPDEAGEQLDLAQQSAPNNSEVYAQRAIRLQALGNFEQAEQEFERAIASRPRQGIGYYGLVSGRTLSEADRPLVARMEAIYSEGTLKGGEAAHLAFALGKAYDNLGDYERALGYFDEANIAARQSWLANRTFDRERFRAQVDAAIGLFNKGFIEANRQLGSESVKPIFIVGMPRSGTTLAEQILSSHKEVGGAGELGFWTRAEERIVDYRNRRLDSGVLRASIDEYLNLIGSIDAERPRVTDKNPANLLVLGLIHIAFPGAALIHLRRHPVDTALSIYMTPMRTPPAFACDRENIVFAYRECARLMEHWRAVLPRDQLVEVDYEAVVEGREETTMRLVAACGLTWDEACLRPETNLRTVRTPSFWQVRQPVYATSVGRWTHYQPWLGAFAELLQNR